ncbi:MAG: META domain-containing protein [Thermomicrobiales bacterium]|nr:META domain-containing protein [Thermomicrobiales bacterium]
MKVFSLAIVIALAHLLPAGGAAFSSARLAGAGAIAPHVWEMDNYTHGANAPVDVADPEHYRLQFLPEGHAEVRLACNQGRAAYTATDGRFALTDLATTDALCPPGSHGEAFAALLLGADRYHFDDTGNLILRGPTGALRLRPALAGVTWQWRGIADTTGDLSLESARPERYTVLFQADGALAIRADCNRARARFMTSGSAMEIRVGGVTRMACQPDSLGSVFVAALDHVAHWYLLDGTLFLSLPDVAGLMIFSPVVSTAAIPPGAD